MTMQSMNGITPTNNAGMGFRRPGVAAAVNANATSAPPRDCSLSVCLRIKDKISTLVRF